MIKGFYTGRTGVQEHQKLLDVAANNLANVNTDGYKAKGAAFQELLYQRVRMPDDYEGKKGTYDANVMYNQGLKPVYDDNGEPVSPVNYYAENKLRSGTGAKLNETAPVMTQGALKATDDPLTVAIVNPRIFISVAHEANGEVIQAYTKNGSFNLSKEEDGVYLTTSDGYYVLDEFGDKIILPEKTMADDITIQVTEEDLRIVSNAYTEEPSATEGNYGYVKEEVIIKIGLYSFDNIYGLANVGDNKYLPTAFSGDAQILDETLIESHNIDLMTSIRPYNIEMSNVSIAQEMVRMIHAQRAFQSNLTVIRTADEIEAYANQLRG